MEERKGEWSESGEEGNLEEEERGKKRELER